MTAPFEAVARPRRSILSDETHALIRAMILDHKIAPQQRVNIDELARTLGVSQTPVRESLARLESEGLIAKEALKGYSATKLLTLKEFNDLFQFRLLIEPWAAEQAARRVNAAGKKALNAEMLAARKAVKFDEDAKIEALTEHDARFHALVTELSGNQWVRNAFAGTHCHLHLFRLFVASKQNLIETESRAQFVQDLFEQYYQSGSGHLAQKEHAAIAKAISDQNPEQASEAMHRHIGSSLRRFSPAAEALNENLPAA
jgi:DNA-binding GntR family transcriptional regulator